MKLSPILFVLITIFLFLIVRLLLSPLSEGFQTSDLDPNFQKAYTDFANFYNAFLTNWEKAIQSSIAADTTQQPLASPSDTATSSAPIASITEMNTYIQNLQQTVGKSLPKITDPMPTEITSADLSKLLQSVPSDPIPFQNALDWMNEKLQTSHSNLGTALTGGKITSDTKEPFEDAVCQNISQCIANNPQIAQEIAKQQQDQAKQSISAQEQKLLPLLLAFNDNQALQNAAQLNQQLVEKSQDIQNQAQSGALFQQINIPKAPSKGYSLPANANALADLKQQNPEKYNEYKQNYKQWYAIKSLTDQINATL